MREFFPEAIELRRDARGDVVLCDPAIWPHCGFASIEEVRILQDAARKHQGPWLELGSFVGWTAAHIAAAGCSVVAVDPEFCDASPTGIAVRALANWTRAGVLDRITMFGGTSADYFAKALRHSARHFSGVFIDGDHTSPEPLNDSVRAAACLEEHGVIVLHDYHGDPVKEAVDWLILNGFSAQTYDTINGIAVCERTQV